MTIMVTIHAECRTIDGDSFALAPCCAYPTSLSVS